jgi:hypothetical protein
MTLRLGLPPNISGKLRMKRRLLATAMLGRPLGAGFQRGSDLQGHVPGWNEAGLPVASEESGT